MDLSKPEPFPLKSSHHRRVLFQTSGEPPPTRTVKEFKERSRKKPRSATTDDLDPTGMTEYFNQGGDPTDISGENSEFLKNPKRLPKRSLTFSAPSRPSTPTVIRSQSCEDLRQPQRQSLLDRFLDFFRSKPKSTSTSDLSGIGKISSSRTSSKGRSTSGTDQGSLDNDNITSPGDKIRTDFGASSGHDSVRKKRQRSFTIEKMKSVDNDSSEEDWLNISMDSKEDSEDDIGTKTPLLVSTSSQTDPVDDLKGDDHSDTDDLKAKRQKRMKKQASLAEDAMNVFRDELLSDEEESQDIESDSVHPTFSSVQEEEPQDESQEESSSEPDVTDQEGPVNSSTVTMDSLLSERDGDTPSLSDNRESTVTESEREPSERTSEVLHPGKGRPQISSSEADSDDPNFFPDLGYDNISGQTISSAEDALGYSFEEQDEPRNEIDQTQLEVSTTSSSTSVSPTSVTSVVTSVPADSSSLINSLPQSTDSSREIRHEDSDNSQDDQHTSIKDIQESTHHPGDPGHGQHMAPVTETFQDQWSSDQHLDQDAMLLSDTSLGTTVDDSPSARPDPEPSANSTLISDVESKELACQISGTEDDSHMEGSTNKHVSPQTLERSDGLSSFYKDGDVFTDSEENLLEPQPGDSGIDLKMPKDSTGDMSDSSVLQSPVLAPGKRLASGDDMVQFGSPSSKKMCPEPHIPPGEDETLGDDKASKDHSSHHSTTPVCSVSDTGPQLSAVKVVALMASHPDSNVTRDATDEAWLRQQVVEQEGDAFDEDEDGGCLIPDIRRGDTGSMENVTLEVVMSDINAILDQERCNLDSSLPVPQPSPRSGQGGSSPPLCTLKDLNKTVVHADTAQTCDTSDGTNLQPSTREDTKTVQDASDPKVEPDMEYMGYYQYTVGLSDTFTTDDVDESQDHNVVMLTEKDLPLSSEPPSLPDATNEAVIRATSAPTHDMESSDNGLTEAGVSAANIVEELIQSDTVAPVTAAIDGKDTRDEDAGDTDNHGDR